MRYLPITDEDRDLIKAALEIIELNFTPDRHTVGAAIRAFSGRIYTGVHLESNAIDVCAEHVALGAAASAGERKYDCIVAVKKNMGTAPRVLSPCGVCRELIRYYGDDIEVIFVENDEVKKCQIKDLLPGPYIDKP